MLLPSSRAKPYRPSLFHCSTAKKIHCMPPCVERRHKDDPLFCFYDRGECGERHIVKNTFLTALLLSKNNCRFTWTTGKLLLSELHRIIDTLLILQPHGQMDPPS